MSTPTIPGAPASWNNQPGQPAPGPYAVIRPPSLAWPIFLGLIGAWIASSKANNLNRQHPGLNLRTGKYWAIALVPMALFVALIVALGLFLAAAGNANTAGSHVSADTPGAVTTAADPNINRPLANSDSSALQLTVPVVGVYTDNGQVAQGSDGTFLIGELKTNQLSVRPLTASAGSSCDGQKVTDNDLKTPGIASSPDGTCYQLGANLLSTDRFKTILVGRTTTGDWGVTLTANGPSQLLADYVSNVPATAPADDYQRVLALVEGDQVVATVQTARVMDGQELHIWPLNGPDAAKAAYTAITGKQPPG